MLTEQDFIDHKSKYPDFRKDEVWDFFRKRKGAYYNVTKVSEIAKKYRRSESVKRWINNMED